MRGKGSGRVRAEVIPDGTAPTLSRFIVRNIEQGSSVLSDGRRGDQGRDDVAVQGYVSPPRIRESFWLAGTEDAAPHAHRAIGQPKAWLLGTHRGVGADRLPVRLDDFVVRWDRRRTPIAGLPTPLGLGANREPTTYEQITGREARVPPRPRGRKAGLTLATDDPRPAGSG